MRLARTAAIALLIITFISTVACDSLSTGKITTPDTTVATVTGYITVRNTPPEYVDMENLGYHGPWFVKINLKPTSMAQADIVYQVDLYENGQYRDTTTVSWNQLHLNIQEIHLVEFPISQEEFSTYNGHQLNNLFSVEVHE